MLANMTASLMEFLELTEVVRPDLVTLNEAAELLEQRVVEAALASEPKLRDQVRRKVFGGGDARVTVAPTIAGLAKVLHPHFQRTRGTDIAAIARELQRIVAREEGAATTSVPVLHDELARWVCMTDRTTAASLEGCSVRKELQVTNWWAVRHYGIS